jgi:predicted Zn-dependent peptidase
MPLVSLPVAGRLATAIAIVLPAGAHYERHDEAGAAHVLEHLAFKGTARHRTATELNRAAEYLGTELDASCTVDCVEFSTAVRAQSAMPAVQLLTEVVATPLLAANELERERAVICQEIADANENPGSRADDLLSAALFPGHRLAKPIAGELSDVRALTHGQLVAFRERQWSPAGGLAVVAGNLDHVDWDVLAQQLSAIPARPTPSAAAPVPPFAPRAELEQRDGDVVHVRLAYHVDGLDLERGRDRAVAEVFSQLIGGPMGSRLLDELRERHALCYWIEGQVWGYQGTTFLSVSCSVAPSDLDETCERIQAILAALRAAGPTDEEHRRFCAYATGAVALDFESVSARVDHAVELIIQHDDHDLDPAAYLLELEAVTREQLRELAAAVQPEPCVACVGPTDNSPFLSD